MLARPFDDASLTPAQPRAELVAFPRGNVRTALDGSIDVHAITRFDGGGARFLFVLCRQDGCWTDDCSCTTLPRPLPRDLHRRLPLPRPGRSTGHLRKTDHHVRRRAHQRDGNDAERRPSRSPTSSARRTTFNGGELGLKFEFQRNRWGLDVFPRIGLGATHSVVTINGTHGRHRRRRDRDDVTSGGLLAQPTNIGTYTQDSFLRRARNRREPELPAHAARQVRRRLLFLYWSNVARAGEQIDTAVNSTILPNSPVHADGRHYRPRFTFVETGFWAQGLNGLDCRW